jgi:hypothetical protein
VLALMGTAKGALYYRWETFGFFLLPLLTSGGTPEPCLHH